MSYKFTGNLSEKEYNAFLKTKDFISYKQETNWNKYNNCENVLYVGVTYRKKICAVAKLEIISQKEDYYFYIAGGYVADYEKTELIIFLNDNIRALAQSMNAYYIKIDEMSECDNILLKSIGFKLKNKINYYSVISLKNNNKFLNTKFFEKTLDLPDIKRSGICFNNITTKKECKKLEETLENWYYKSNYSFEQLLNIYKKRVMIITMNIDLVFYLNTLRDNCAKDSEIIMAEELIKECGDELILGFAILLLPLNKTNIFCIEAKDNGAFPNLNITNQLKFEMIKTAINKKYENIIYSNSKNNYKYIDFEYHLPINKWKYLKKKIIK